MKLFYINISYGIKKLLLNNNILHNNLVWIICLSFHRCIETNFNSYPKMEKKTNKDNKENEFNRTILNLGKTVPINGTKTTCKCSPIMRTVFNRATVDRTLFSTRLQCEREQPCPVKPVDTENAENKTRHPATRGGFRLFILSRGINTGERVKYFDIGKNRAVTWFEWHANERAFTKSDSSSRAASF